MIEVSNLAYMWHVFLLSYVQCIIILDRVISQLDTIKSIVLGVWSWASSRVLFSQQKYNVFTWYHLQFVCSLFLWEGGQGSIAYRAVRQTRIYEYCKLLDILQSNIIRYWKQHERKKSQSCAHTMNYTPHCSWYIVYRDANRLSTIKFCSTWYKMDWIMR